MNCVGVGKILETGQWDEVYVPPAPGDSGTAIGAALAACRDATGTVPGDLVRSCYLGPAYPDFTPAAEPAPGLTARQVDKPAWFLAEQLAAGKIAGLFQGRLEAGPRALGNRSILASPLIPDVAGRLNAAVKFREPFRPFAPVILAEHAPTYFRLGQPSPFMAIAMPATSLAREKVPAIVHANGTARVQTLARAENPFLADVLDRFTELTGVPVLINTSLNVKGKPISGTPQMAIDIVPEQGSDAGDQRAGGVRLAVTGMAEQVPLGAKGPSPCGPRTCMSGSPGLSTSARRERRCSPTSTTSGASASCASRCRALPRRSTPRSGTRWSAISP